MAGSGTGGNEGFEPVVAAERVGDAEAAPEDAARRQDSAERPARRFTTSSVSRGERDRMVKEARSVKFPVAVRGYERAAVDRYVEQVNRLVAELEISSSSESAVRHALAEVTEETREILQHAHETADEVVLRSRAKANETVEQAEHEAQEILGDALREAEETRELVGGEADELMENARRELAELRAETTREMTEARAAGARETEQLRSGAKAEADEVLGRARRRADELLLAAETRARELGDNVDRIWLERRRLIEDLRALGEQLLAIGEAESKRFPRLPGVEQTNAGASPEQAQAELATTLQEAIHSGPAASELI